ncbi:MAG: FKBP-type peptidyl-prolyl cis-trans isomerase [Moraxella sp.]|nr:FKBP-type peptidyl-prolyl cis-trans isomerase [Moraxella sp.]
MKTKAIQALMSAALLTGVALTTAQATAAPHTTAQGLQYQIIKDAQGAKPTINDEVEIRFIAYDAKGEVLEGTLNNMPVVMPVSVMFQGLQQGVLMMPVGSTYEFNIPAHLGYSEEGINGTQAATYRVELLRINP